SASSRPPAAWVRTRARLGVKRIGVDRVCSEPFVIRFLHQQDGLLNSGHEDDCLVGIERDGILRRHEVLGYEMLRPGTRAPEPPSPVTDGCTGIKNGLFAKSL